MSAKRPMLLILTLAICAALSLPTQAQEDISAVLSVDGADADTEMKMTASGSNLLLEMQSEQGEVAVVWKEEAMLMIMHSQRMYMEFTREMMERMRGMMGNMGNMGNMGAEADEDSFDPSQMSFSRTGNTDTINGMSAFEVQATGPDGDQAMLWMTGDTDVGLFQVMTRLASAFDSMAMPGMNRGNPGMAKMNRYMGLAKAQGLPDGVVVRVVDTDASTTMTLGEVTEGPFPASLFAAPEGYTKQSMPFQD